MNVFDEIEKHFDDALQCHRCNRWTRLKGKDKVQCHNCKTMLDGDVPDMVQMRNEEPEVYGGE